jgi:hypothetical protein
MIATTASAAAGNRPGLVMDGVPLPGQRIKSPQRAHLGQIPYPIACSWPRWVRASAAACAQLRRPSFIKMFETWESRRDGASSRSSTCADLSVECTRWLGFGPQSGRLL